MTTATVCDPWIERLIHDGRLGPGARGLSREESARQYNDCNGLVASDQDFLYTPTQAACTVRELLGDIGLDIPEGARVLLTDGDGGSRCWSYFVELGQIEYACAQHRLVTGEFVNPKALVAALPWA